MDALPLGTLTPLGVLCVVLAFPYLQMARGRLVPRATVDEMIKDHVREVAALTADHEREMEVLTHDRDEWRAEARIKDSRITALSEHNTILLREVVPALNQHLAAVREVGAKARADEA